MEFYGILIQWCNDQSELSETSPGGLSDFHPTFPAHQPSGWCFHIWRWSHEVRQWESGGLGTPNIKPENTMGDPWSSIFPWFVVLLHGYQSWYFYIFLTFWDVSNGRRHVPGDHSLIPSITQVERLQGWSQSCGFQKGRLMDGGWWKSCCGTSKIWEKNGKRGMLESTWLYVRLLWFLGLCSMFVPYLWCFLLWGFWVKFVKKCSSLPCWLFLLR